MTATTTPATTNPGATTAPGPAVGTGTRSRLTDALQHLATRIPRPASDRILRWAGPVLLPAGAILILLGWYGAANTTRVFLQIPYLISGGLLGLGTMFAGGFLYFARWMTDLLQQSRSDAEEARATAHRSAAALERIEALLAERPSAVAAPGVPHPTPASAAPPLVATEKGSMVHRSECRLVAGRPTHPVDTDGPMRRCQVCRPAAG